MIAKKLAVVAATAALFEQALAFNAHRHLHQAQKRDQTETKWVTVYEVVTKVAGQPDTAPTQPAAVAEQPKAEVKEEVKPEAVEAPVTTVIVAPTPDEVQPAPQQTTLAKVTKPKADTPKVDAPKAEVAPEEAPKPSKTKAAPQPKKTQKASGSSGSGSFGFSPKRGLAYNGPTLVNAYATHSDKFGWAHNWNSEDEGLEANVNFVPTLWGDIDVHTSRFDANCKKALDNGAKAIFSFNEPDHAGQAHMDAGAAATAHVKYLNKYSGQAAIGSPSITNSGNAGEGIEWLEAWIKACNGECAYDFVNIHWYSEALYKDTLFEHIEAAHKASGKPVVLSEFAPLDTDPAVVAAFIEDVIPKLDALDSLIGYSYFMVSEGRLMDSATQLSKPGQAYASA